MQIHWLKGVGALHNEVMKPDAILLFTVEEITLRLIHSSVLPSLKDRL